MGARLRQPGNPAGGVTMARNIKSAAIFFQQEEADCYSRARYWRDLYDWADYHRSGEAAESLRAMRLRYHAYWAREAEWLATIARRNVAALLGQPADDNYHAYPPAPRINPIPDHGGNAGGIGA